MLDKIMMGNSDLIVNLRWNSKAITNHSTIINAHLSQFKTLL
jgi:hypothetical protein